MIEFRIQIVPVKSGCVNSRNEQRRMFKNQDKINPNFFELLNNPNVQKEVEKVWKAFGFNPGSIPRDINLSEVLKNGNKNRISNQELKKIEEDTTNNLHKEVKDFLSRKSKGEIIELLDNKLSIDSLGDLLKE